MPTPGMAGFVGGDIIVEFAGGKDTQHRLHSVHLARLPRVQLNNDQLHMQLCYMAGWVEWKRVRESDPG